MIRFLRSLLVGVAALSACLLASEAGRRILDGYRVWGVELTKNPDSVDLTWSDGRSTDALLRSIALDIDADPAWFHDRPAPLAGTAPEWADKRRTAVDPSANYIFNAATVKAAGLQTYLQKNGAALGEMFTFRSPYGDTFPAYRFYPNIQSGFGFTNDFGWRSRPISKVKPPDVIRIAALGDSTTNDYPGMVEHWLNRWSTERRLGVRFEMIHAARPGTGASDAAAILDYELDEVDPDYVIVYGYGSAIFAADALVTLPAGVVRGQPESAPDTAGWFAHVTDRASATLEPLSRRSAAAGFLRSRIMGQRGGALAAEPRKPAARIAFPPEIDEQSPDIDAIANHATGGLMGLEAYVQGLNRLDRVATSRNIGLFVSTFRVVAFDGMLLGKGDSANGGLLYSAINERYWWPYTYAQIHRLMAFYNRTLETWARAKGHGVIPINEQMPWRPELYGDGMHELPVGEALHAWIVLQAMMPRIRGDLANHSRPAAAARLRAVRDEYWKIERHSVAEVTNRTAVNELSRPPDPSDEVPGAFPLAKIEPAYEKAQVVRGDVPVITTAEESSAYAAAVPLDRSLANLSGRAWVSVRVRVTAGRVSIGLLDKSGSRFVSQAVAEAAPELQDVYLTVEDLSTVSRLMVSNNRAGETGRSIVELHGIQLMRFRP